MKSFDSLNLTVGVNTIEIIELKKSFDSVIFWGYNPEKEEYSVHCYDNNSFGQGFYTRVRKDAEAEFIKRITKELKKEVGNAFWTSNLCSWILLDRVDEEKNIAYCKEMRKDKESGELVDLPTEQREFPEGIEMTILEAYQAFIEDYQ